MGKKNNPKHSTWLKYQYKAAQKSVTTCIGKIPAGPKDSVPGRGAGAALWSLNLGLCELGVRQAKGRVGASSRCFVLRVSVGVRGWRRPSVGQLCECGGAGWRRPSVGQLCARGGVGWRRPSVGGPALWAWGCRVQEAQCGAAVSLPPHPTPTAGHGSVCRMPGKKQRHFIVIFRHHHRKVNIDCFMMWQPLLTGHAGRPWSLSAEFSHSCNSCTSLLNSWHCFICTFPRPCPFHYANILWPVPLDTFSPNSIFIIIVRQVFFLAFGEWENLRTEHQI